MLQKRAAPKDGPFPLDQLRDFRDAASVRSAPRLRNSSAITVYSPKDRQSWAVRFQPCPAAWFWYW